MIYFVQLTLYLEYMKIIWQRVFLTVQAYLTPDQIILQGLVLTDM